MTVQPAVLRRASDDAKPFVPYVEAALDRLIARSVSPPATRRQILDEAKNFTFAT
jgi:hypothetical protein